MFEDLKYEMNSVGLRHLSGVLKEGQLSVCRLCKSCGTSHLTSLISKNGVEILVNILNLMTKVLGIKGGGNTVKNTGS